MTPVFKFIYKLTLLLITLFTIHIGVLKLSSQPLFENYIIASYSIHLVLAVIIYGILYLRRIPQHDVLGFLFMGGSILKFIVFFAVFNPWFKQDGEISKLEFASFFIPYTACLIYESMAIIKLLNSK
ncbi:MAG: hypothetical protein JKY08_05605 [Flavobacteriaceae bacterium]|nr:hypothetical protein [Flavobacteriaceae bacterium]